jgi:hypothetical protein
MTYLNRGGHDWDTTRMINSQLGRGEGALYEASPKGLHKFLRALALRLLAGKEVNEHFRPMVDVCHVTHIRYHYFLRIEDMNEWYPCWESALDLHNFTMRGWDYHRKHRSDWYSSQNRGCWWAPAGQTCKHFYDGQHMEPDPYDDQRFNSVVAANADVHATHADNKWREFYTQVTGDIVYKLYKSDFDLFGYQKETFVQ